MSANRPDADTPLGYQIGLDPDVQRAAAALRKALISTACAAGHELQTYAVIWATRVGNDCYGGCLIEGNTTAEVIELMADVLIDDSNDVALPPLGRVN